MRSGSRSSSERVVHGGGGYLARVNYGTRLSAARIGAGFMIVVAVIGVALAALGKASMLTGASGIATLAIFGWWSHLWGWRGDPPPGARNRLPWQH